MIIVRYTCAGCGLKDREVIVPERQPGQDILVYMNQVVIACVTEDHYDVRPRCKQAAMADVIVPASDKGIGFK